MQARDRGEGNTQGQAAGGEAVHAPAADDDAGEGTANGVAVRRDQGV